jgi:hypothetical protein
VHPALWQDLLTERVRDRQADACRSRLARAARRARHRSPARPTPTEEGQFGCLQATRLRSGASRGSGWARPAVPVAAPVS